MFTNIMYVINAHIMFKLLYRNNICITTPMTV